MAGVALINKMAVALTESAAGDKASGRVPPSPEETWRQP